MKPTSIIFLILAVVLIAAGLGTCFIAQNFAEKNDVQLFDQKNDENDNFVVSNDFFDKELSRINLVLKDADVKISGNSSQSRIDIYNFPKNTYNYSTNSKTLQLDNTVGLVNLFKFTESGFEFSGLRHYLNFKTYTDRPKSVAINISSYEKIKVINIKVENGNVDIDNIKYRADYTIDVVNGDINIDSVSTSSMIGINVTGEGDVKMSGCSVNNLDININKGNFEFYSNVYAMESYKALTSLGTIYVNGDDVGGEYISELPISSSRLSINIAAGDVRIGPIQ